MSVACAQVAADSFDAAGDVAQARKRAVAYHREAKRYCKRICQKASSASALPLPVLGQSWHALGTQYAKLSRLKNYNDHDTTRAIASFTQALQRMQSADQPAGYRGRLDAVCDWLAHHRQSPWWRGKREQAVRRAQAWEDARVLLHVPVSDDARTNLWEVVADLGVWCTDQASTDTIARYFVPILEAALAKPVSGPDYGNPYTAALALLRHHRACFVAVFEAIRRALNAGGIQALHLPALLACYDQVVAADPGLALSATADLLQVRALFWSDSHAMGSLVFTAGRYLEAAEASGDTSAGHAALQVICDVAEHTPQDETASLAVQMLGFAGKRLPTHGVAVVEQLAHIAQVRGTQPDADAENLRQATLVALAPCCKKPTCRPVREAARRAMARVAVLDGSGLQGQA